jgi:hypothetical protein
MRRTNLFSTSFRLASPYNPRSYLHKQLTLDEASPCLTFDDVLNPIGILPVVQTEIPPGSRFIVYPGLDLLALHIMNKIWMEKQKTDLALFQ